jgi:hypothetical protein
MEVELWRRGPSGIRAHEQVPHRLAAAACRAGPISGRSAGSSARAAGRLVVLDDDPTGTQTVHGLDVLADWSVGVPGGGPGRPAPLLLRPHEHPQPAGADAAALVRGRRGQPVCRRGPPAWTISPSSAAAIPRCGAILRRSWSALERASPRLRREDRHSRVLRGRPLHDRQRPLRRRRGRTSSPRPRPSSRGTGSSATPNPT